MQVKIDEEFRQLVPPQRPDENQLLEESLLKNGYDPAYPIIIWDGFLIDGHNRYDLCKKHGIEFTFLEKDFDNRHDVINWIIDNQLSRRNLEPLQYSFLRGKRLKDDKKEPFRPKIDIKSDNVTDLISKNNETSRKIADEFKVSPRTVYRDEKFAKNVDMVAKNAGVNPHEILSRGVASQRDFESVAKMEPEKQKVVIEKVLNNEVKTVKDALKEVKKEEIEEIKTVESIEPEEEPLKCESGKWYQLGDHLLYCGSNEDESFRRCLEGHPASFAFADPPYNADVADWDNNFTWSQDWLMDYAPVVAVTPGTNSIYSFMNKTKMPYTWSVACWIDNGMTRGALGFANWIYTAVFSNDNIYCNSQDFLRVTISNTETKETAHKGRKPASLIAWLFERFSKTSDYVIDPFLGSGTSLLVAEKMDRKCIGAEKLPKFCDQIISRWEQLSGEKAVIYEN